MKENIPCPKSPEKIKTIRSKRQKLGKSDRMKFLCNYRLLAFHEIVQQKYGVEIEEVYIIYVECHQGHWLFGFFGILILETSINAGMFTVSYVIGCVLLNKIKLKRAVHSMFD